MQAIWLEAGHLGLRDDVLQPVPLAGEALIRVLKAGICNTDIELVRGYYPFTGVLGHEFVGVVEAGPTAWIGRRVVGEINAVCGICLTCLAGRRSHCEQRTVLGIIGRHGAFAEYLTLPLENLHGVPEQLSTAAATFTEPVAAALQIQEQIQFQPTANVLVVGDGKLGQLIAQTLGLTACQLTVVGRHSEKLAHLAKRNIKTVLESELPDKRVFDLAIECTGNASGFALACKSLRPGGTLVMKSTYRGRLSIDAAALVVDEITLVGSRCGPFAPALRLLADGKIDITYLIQAQYPLDAGLAAFSQARKSGVMKVLLDIAAE